MKRFLIIFLCFLPGFCGIGHLTAQTLSNLQRVIVETREPILLSGDRPVLPASIIIMAAEDKIPLPDSSWSLQGNRLIWLVDSLPFPLEVRFRLAPISLTQSFSLLDSSRLTRDSTGPLIGLALQPEANTNPLIRFPGLQYSGAFTRGFSVGNRQDLTLNSSLNLQLAGELGDGIGLRAAISDENIPIQPEGNTRQLREFDRVFIALDKGPNELIAGDYEISSGPEHFLRYFKKLQGATVKNELTAGKKLQISNQASLAVSRGKFGRNLLSIQEGNQGPYRLEGSQGERFIIILAGTERVWLDGRPLERGVENDYIIDYNQGEITFMPRLLIRQESRIIIEFEYADQNYLRSLYTLQSAISSEDWSFYAHLYSEQDGRNSSDLSESEIEILEGAGDNPLLAVASGVRQEELFSPGRAMYEWRDTLTSCGSDSILVFSKDPAKALFTARWTFVGQGNGNYRLDSTQFANERVYRWVAPDPTTCRLSGDYAPVVRLTAPRQQQVLTLGGQVKVGKGNLQSELAFDNTDLNRFSQLDNSDNQGLAFFGSFDQLLPLSQGPEPDWQLEAGIDYEFVQATFNGIAPWRNPEFLRDWGLADFSGQTDATSANEQLVTARLRLLAPHTNIEYDLGAFLRSNAYSALRHRILADYQNPSWRLQIGADLLNATQSGADRQFYRPQLETAYRLFKNKNWEIGAAASGEFNRREDSTSKNLLPQSFANHQYRLFLHRLSEEGWSGNMYFQNRTDQQAGEAQFEAYAKTRELGFEGSWSGKGLRLGGQLTFRNRELVDSSSLNTLLGRIDLGLQLWKGVIRANSRYELGSGQEPRREFTYIKVAAGEGTYIWQDSLYNNDGIIQPNEMALAPFPDIADYIRVSVFSNSFIQTNQVGLNQSLQIEPRIAWFNSKDKFRQFLGKLSSQTTLNVNRKVSSASSNFVWNPLQIELSDTNLVSTTSLFRQLLFYNRGDRRFELQAEWTENRSKIAQTTGFESRSRREGVLRPRWSPIDAIRLEGTIRNGQQERGSQFFEENEYTIYFFRTRLEASWIPSARFQSGVSMEWQRDEDRLPEAGDQAERVRLAWNSSFSKAATSNLQTSLAFTLVDYRGDPSGPIGFAILNGLQDGRNWQWGVTLNQQIGKLLQLRLSYEGRKTGSAPVVHLGRAQVAALF